uniref:Uncharacterized protein n=1 Tax=viral metagenome TaxID=1070528 RepID=A0A6M3XMI9_9ZZZZ
MVFDRLIRKDYHIEDMEKICQSCGIKFKTCRRARKFCSRRCFGKSLEKLCPHGNKKLECRQCWADYRRERYHRDVDFRRRVKEIVRKSDKKHRYRRRLYDRTHSEQTKKRQYKWYVKNLFKTHIYNKIKSHPDEYPLDQKCIFCGIKDKLEHAHLDYKDDGHNYVTTCHQCNHWMNIPIRNP